VPKKIRSCAAMRHDDTFSFPPDHAAQHAQRSGPDERHKRDHFYTSEVSASSSVASGEKDDINCDACDWLRKHATPRCVRCGWVDERAKRNIKNNTPCVSRWPDPWFVIAREERVPASSWPLTCTSCPTTASVLFFTARRTSKPYVKKCNVSRQKTIVWSPWRRPKPRRRRQRRARLLRHNRSRCKRSRRRSTDRESVARSAS